MTIEVGNANNGIPMGAYVPSSGGSGAGGLKTVVVDTLPETGEEGILYLVPEQSSAGTNNFKEYIWLSDENKYEELGYTDIDLSGYYTKEEIDSSLSQKQDKISTVSPLKISSAVVTNQTNCTYIDGTITSLGTASRTGSSIVSNTLQLDISTGLSIVDDKLTLSPATTSTLGGVQPDGTTITTTADGIISSVADPGGTLQTQITALQTTIAEKQNTIQEEHSGMYWYNNKMWLNLANTDSYLDVYIADTTATATTGFNQSTININMTNLKNALTGGLNVIKLTQAEYDALETKDTNTMYVVVG